jgi:hypothetical protein
MPNLVGTGLNQVPTNGMLGGLAYQSPDHASIKDLDLKYLSQINASTADTAVDVFVYDTSRDTDGGAWRQRTQHTSWYNETLNTETRGSRREFPAVAVIVTIARELLIYDGDDPDLPLWMRFVMGKDNNKGKLLGYEGTTEPVKCVYALNGIIATGEGYSVLAPFHTINFVSDSAYGYNTSTSNYTSYPQYTGKWVTGIGNRNTGGGYVGDSSSTAPTIVNVEINDIAMTVLPTAPIDPDTGLQVPTIAVATDGGVSVIKDDGNVVDMVSTASNNDVLGIKFIGDNKLMIRCQNSGAYANIHQASIHEIPSSDESATYYSNLASHIVRYTGADVTSGLAITPASYTSSDVDIDHIEHLKTNKTNNLAFGFNDRLTLVKETNIIDAVENNASVAFATTSYNTGWMHGDIKGAFLSDTDATNVTGTELITNGTFGSDVSGWSSNYSTITHQSGQAKVTASGTNILITQQLSGLVVGKKYVVTATVTPYIGASGSYWGFYLSNNYTSVIKYISINDQTTTIVSTTFTATATDNYISFGASSGTISSSEYVLIDNVSVRLAEEDRSVNDNGLQVFGTITKSPVATGAELVAYSGWSSSNYLRQPYNSDLNAGTGNFHIMCWVKGNQLMLWHRAGDGNLTDLRCEFPVSGGNANKPRFYMYDGTSGGFISFFATQAFDTTTWHHCVWVKDSPTTGKLYIDGVLDSSGTASNGPVDITSTSANLTIGDRADSTGEPFNGSVALFRTGASAPSAEQIKKIYNDEKVLFQENADCTLYGSSDAVTALAYDEKTNLLHVGTSSGRSDFNGLRRINNTTEAVTTAISAYDGSIAQQ